MKVYHTSNINDEAKKKAKEGGVNYLIRHDSDIFDEGIVTKEQAQKYIDHLNTKDEVRYPEFLLSDLLRKTVLKN